MAYLKFPFKIISGITVLLFLLSVQGNITHGLDFDEKHHSQHHCSLFQSCTDVMPSIAPAVAVISAGIIKSQQLPTLLSKQRPLAAHARGPPKRKFTL